MRLGAAWALVCALGGLSGTARAGEDAPPQGSAAAKGRPASDEKTKATPAPEPGKKPGAHLHVPESIRRGRSTQDEDEPKTLFELGPPEVMNALGPMRLTPGAWVEYGMRLLGHEATRVRFSVLAPAPAEGKVWLEIVTASAIGMPTAVRMLVHGDPNDPRNVERMFVLVAGQAPMELPVDEGATVFEAKAKEKKPPAPDAKVTQLGREKVKVHAGAFDAKKLRVTHQKEQTLVWTNDSVPLFPLVRASGRDYDIELFDSGQTGAHSMFDDEGNRQPAAQGNGSDKVK